MYNVLCLVAKQCSVQQISNMYEVAGALPHQQSFVLTPGTAALPSELSLNSQLSPRQSAQGYPRPLRAQLEHSELSLNAQLSLGPDSPALRVHVRSYLFAFPCFPFCPPSPCNSLLNHLPHLGAPFPTQDDVGCLLLVSVYTLSDDHWRV